MEPDHHFSVRA